MNRVLNIKTFPLRFKVNLFGFSKIDGAADKDREKRKAHKYFILVHLINPSS
ncbi:hypothetical protein TM233_67350 [Bradyrhizobium sp. TM233]|nr:hypothetical protein TM233_67350 [Bradyrhizobium sp. TM233]